MVYIRELRGRPGPGTKIEKLALHCICSFAFGSKLLKINYLVHLKAFYEDQLFEKDGFSYF